MRAFFAVDLDPGARRAASEAASLLRSEVDGAVRWVSPENYHVTLRFLGEIEAERAQALAEGARRAVAPLAPFTLRLGVSSGFPTRRRPRVVVLGLAPEEALRRLAERVEGAVVAAGLPAESRPFRAHLTLGRVRRGGRPRMADAETSADAAFPVESVVLYESELRPQGPRYTPFARLPLMGGADPDPDSPSKPVEGNQHGQA